MSSPYPVLGNRSIDQWKVTELKEELKRRKLTTKGLKDDLIRRLDEALRVEMENAKQDADNGVDFGSKPVVGEKDAQTVPVAAATAKGLANSGGNKNKNKNTDSVMVQVDINDSAAAFDQGKVEEGDILGGTAARVEELLVVHSTNVETSIKVTETVISEVALSEHNLENMNIETQKENGNSKSLMGNEDLKPQLENEDSMPQLENEDPKPQLEGEDSKPQLENEDSKPQLESEDSKPQLENEGLKPPPEGVMLDSSTPENQVSEVSPILGSQVKSDSISTDSVSINEKIELKDNVIADHVKLELDVVNPEMVEPSSSNVVPVGGESHPMDVEVPHENKESDGGKDDNSATDADISKKIDSADLGYSEKLNLDRSSGDDSMEEDVLESRQIDSKYNSEEVENRSEKSEVPVVKEESHVAILGDAISAEKKDVHVENENRPAALAEKRKLNDQAAVGNNEPLKRQRRWNSEGLKLPEPQSSTTPTTTPKETFQTTPKDTIQPTASKRNFSRSDSTNSENTPKERVVPPSQKPPTNSLRIDRFLRPFTLKAVHELLGKTGSVTSFWMDHIKTHCYVTYSSVEEATETRNAVYNLQWPPNGGRLLVAEFVDPQEVKTRAEEAPQTPTTPASAGPTVPPAPPTSQPQPSPRQPRQQLPPPPPVLPPPPPLSNPPQTRERVHLPPPPPLPEKLDPPIVTLDDLFRKTKATPRIYYLPLSEEQVAAKLAAHGKNTKQSAGVASKKELSQLSRRIQFVDGFGFLPGVLRVETEFSLVVLDKAAIVAEGDYEKNGGGAPNPWKLCSVKRVEEVKMMIRLLPIWATTIIFWTTYAQMITFSVEHASTMERSIGNFQIPAGSLTVFFVAAIMITLAIYDRLIMPPWKALTGKPGIFRGMAAAVLCERKRLSVAKAVGGGATLPISVFFLIPQFVLVGSGEAFIYTGQLDFFITGSPKGMKTMSTGLFLTTLSLGFFVSSFLVSVVKRVTGSKDGHGWVADNINNGRLDCFYGLLAVLGIINFVAYLFCAAWYKASKPKSSLQMGNIV